MKVSFVNPPFLPRFSRESRSPSVTKSNTLYYPHWLCYAAAATSALEGVEIDVVDGCATSQSPAEVFDRVVDFKPKLLIVDTSTPSVYSDIRFAAGIKQALPNCLVAVVGPHVTATIPETFEYAAGNQLELNLVLNGEYDSTVKNLVERLKNGEDWTTLAGLAYIDSSGSVTDNGKAPPINNLDSIPFVTEIYSKYLDIPRYFMAHTKYPMVTVITGRGCPNHCTFCQLPQVMYGHTYRTRSVTNVVDEFEFISKHLSSVKGVMIEDDTFTANQARVKEICQEIIKRGIRNLEFTCNARADVKRETLDLMHQAGFRMMCVGFESGDQDTLNKMRKGTKQNIILDFVKNSKESKVKVHGCFMYGNREETYQTMNRTLDFALSLDIDSAQFYPIMVSPGTADYDYYKREGMLASEDFSLWLTDDGQHRSTIVRDTLSNREIEDFCDYSRRRFYLRPKYIAYKAWESLSSLDHLLKNLRGFVVLVKHLVFRPGSAPK